MSNKQEYLETIHRLTSVSRETREQLDILLQGPDHMLIPLSALRAPFESIKAILAAQEAGLVQVVEMDLQIEDLLENALAKVQKQ